MFDGNGEIGLVASQILHFRRLQKFRSFEALQQQWTNNSKPNDSVAYGSEKVDKQEQKIWKRNPGKQASSKIEPLQVGI
jgi:hypothetical protein